MFLIIVFKAKIEITLFMVSVHVGVCGSVYKYNVKVVSHIAMGDI